MILLNSKSVLNCDEFEEGIHNNEIKEIIRGIINKCG